MIFIPRMIQLLAQPTAGKEIRHGSRLLRPGFCLFLLIVFSTTAFARPLPSAGARALALGNAYVAEHEDVNVLFFNPAGINRLGGAQLSLNYGRLNLASPLTISEGHAAFATPAVIQGRAVVAGAGVLGQSLGPGVHRMDIYTVVAAEIPTQGTIPWPLHGGAALRIRNQAGSDKDSAIGSDEFGLGLDGGVMTEFNEDFSVGLSLLDLFPSGVNPPGGRLRIGSRYRFRRIINLLSDIELRSKSTALNIGLERLFYRDLLRLRIGNGFRNDKVDHIAVGAGFNFSPTQFDVAYLIPLDTLNDLSEQFRMSLIYRFNAPRFSELYYDRALDLAEETERRIAQLEEKETRLRVDLQDLEQARRLADEDLARVSTRRAEGQKDVDDRILKAEARAAEAEERARQMEEKVRDAEEKIRRAGRISAPRPATTTVPVKIERTHLVQPGDSLRSLAEKYYKDANRWKAIYDANPDKVERGRPIPGKTLVIPD